MNNHSQVYNQNAELPMRLPYTVSRLVTTSLPRRLGIVCAAASLVLGGCSTYEAGTPKAAVNYRNPTAAEPENHVRSLEQVIQDQRDWYQMNE
jgi:hypothetical protein